MLASELAKPWVGVEGSLQGYVIGRREPLDAEYWDKLALALWFKT